MRGHVHKRGSTWSVVYDEPAAEAGKRRQRTKGGFATKREAQAFLTRTLARIGEGTYAAPSKVTVGQFLSDEWLPAIEGTVRPATASLYELAVRRWITPRIGGVRLQALSGGHLNGLYRTLEQRGLSVETRRTTHTVLHRACRDAVRWGKLPRNPATMADPPRRGRSKAQSWTAAELRRFLQHVRDDRLFALWRLMATTGMRRGEALGLTWRCLDLEGGLLSVEQQLVRSKGGASFSAPKSARSRRTVALDPETVAALRRHRQTQLLERDLAGEAYQEQDVVFCDELGDPIGPQVLTRAFGKRRKAAGISTGSLHVLRHTTATLALSNGVPVHVLAARLGDRPEQILSTYAHLLPQSDEVAAERVAAALAAR